MRGTDGQAVVGLWRRDVIRFRRSKARVASSLALPVLFLIGFWVGFGSIDLQEAGGVGYREFLVPGVVGMTMLFAAAVGGISVVVDREVGVLKALLVAPVDRISLGLGRVAGGTTTAVVQGGLVLALAIAIGFRPASWTGLALAVVFMGLAGATFTGLGLAIGSRLADFQAFNLVFNFVLFPLVFLSGAFYPVSRLPRPAAYLAYANPLTYCVDGLRAVLVGASVYPAIVDLAASAGFAVACVLLGARAFSGADAV